MAMINGGELREWRRSRGWDVPELARRLRRTADEPIAAHEGLIRMIRAWERGDHRPSERYELLHRRLGLPSGNETGADPQPPPTRRQEGTEPVRRRTFVELTAISLAGAILPGAAAGAISAKASPRRTTPGSWTPRTSSCTDPSCWCGIT
jgi:transcriptional regulator with XRE-family HTH domain